MQRGYRGGVYFPQVDAQTAVYTWYTKDSLLSIEAEYEALSIFDNEAQFTGTLFITDKGMVGDGEITVGQIRVRGDSLVFNDLDFKSKNSDFIVVDKDDPEIIHFKAKDVSITYDVWRHISKF
ncbi:MAG: hypothetical protein R3B93_10790 [Bacteroidia bacterium]